MNRKQARAARPFSVELQAEVELRSTASSRLAVASPLVASPLLLRAFNALRAPHPLVSSSMVLNFRASSTTIARRSSPRPRSRRTTRWRTGTIRRCSSAASRCTRASRSSRCAPRASHACARFPELLGGHLIVRRLREMRMHVLALLNH